MRISQDVDNLGIKNALTWTTSITIIQLSPLYMPNMTVMDARYTYSSQINTLKSALHFIASVACYLIFEICWLALAHPFFLNIVGINFKFNEENKQEHQDKLIKIAIISFKSKDKTQQKQRLQSE